LALDVSKEPNASIFKGQGDREDDKSRDLNPHKHRSGNLSMLAQTTEQLKLLTACTAAGLPTRLQHTDTFIPLLYIPQ